jgi:formate hydrogenlyase subunit 6/NADH:ubiquinone oxidoreductase subunit I
MMSKYWANFGWDSQTGKPTNQTLEKLGIAHFSMISEQAKNGAPSYQINASCTGCGACRKICPTGAITGEKKKKHTIEANLCIGCGACGRVCPADSIEDSLGQPCRRLKRSEWAEPVLNRNKCSSCGICIDACPVSCLSLSRDGKNGVYPHPYLNDKTRCIGCSLCATGCPTGAMIMVQ